jgi:hypothetical protein
MLFIEIAFALAGDVTIRTNVKEECVGDVLGDWIRMQIGAGEDHSEAIDREAYSITIKLDLADDTFTTVSDTGNAGLTCGIVMAAHSRLELGRVKFLEV